MTPEGEIRDYFIKRCAELGIFQMKLEPPPIGIPDRLLVYYGHSYFVELKAPGERVNPKSCQGYYQRKLRLSPTKATTVEINSKEGVDVFLGSL